MKGAMTKNKKLLLVFLLLAVILILMLMPGFYARWMADDYCLNAGAQNSAFFFFVKQTVQNWTGKFTYVALAWLFARISASSYGWLVLASCVLWLTGLSLLFGRLFSLRAEKLSFWTAPILGLLLLIGLFRTSPNLYQNLFWLTGLLVYTWGLLLFTWVLYLCLVFLRAERLTALWLLPISILGFLACGFGETVVVAQISFYALSLLACLVFAGGELRKRGLILSGILLGLSMTALLLAYFAPGTRVREGLLHVGLPLVRLIGLSLRNVVHVYGRLLLLNPVWVLFAFGLAFFLGVYFGSEKASILKLKDLGMIWLSVAIGNVLIGLAVCAVVVWFIQAYPDDRIIFVPYFFAFLSIVSLGFLSGHFFSEKLKKLLGTKEKCLYPTALLILLTLCVLTGVSFAKSRPGLHDYAMRWDARDQMIREEVRRGKVDLIIPGLESRHDLPDLQLEADDWVNQCTAAYYGVERITGR